MPTVSLEDQGEWDVPVIHLKEARWRTVWGSTGYFVNIPTRPSQYYPVEFNHNFMCWTEITWDTPQARWNIMRPTGPDYSCDIFEDEVQTAGQVGPMDGQPPQTPRTPAPSTEDEDKRSEHSKNTIKSGAPGNTTEEETLANLAESIHINPPMATMTKTQMFNKETHYPRREMMEEIDPQTGHWARWVANIVDNAAALWQATRPDRADPPSGGPERLPELLPIWLPQDDIPAQGFPGGGYPGGGDFQAEEYPEEEEDTLEKQVLPEWDLQGEVGDPHWFKYHNHNQENW